MLSGCTPNLVGDDSGAMADELAEQGYLSAHVQASGFHGTAYEGYRRVVKGLLDFVSKGPAGAPARTEGLVNIFGIVPGQDSFWEGDLLQLSDDLAKAGFIPNPLFGLDQSLENWKRTPSAELSIVLSPWGKEAAEYLKTKFGIPHAGGGYLPVGADETQDLLIAVARALGRDEEKVRANLEERDRLYDRFLERFADAYFNFGFQSDFSVAGPVSQAIGITRFLSGTLGLEPKTVIVTDRPPLDEASARALLPGSAGAARLVFLEDHYEIAALLKKERTGLILASSLEKDIADRMGAAHLSVSFPVTDRVLAHRGYAGYSGGLNLAEDIGSALISRL